MKRLVILATVITCIFSFVACKSDDSSNKNTDKNETTTTTSATENADNQNTPETDEPKKEFNAQAILDEILASYTFNDMTELEDVVFLEVLYGVNSADVKQFAMYINETGITADEIIIIEAVDDEASQRVYDLILNWYTAKGIQMKDYLPEEYKKIEKSNVKISGNYIYMIVADNNTDIEKIVEKYI